MRIRLLLLGIPLAFAWLAPAAEAGMRTDYDPVLKKWVTYDTKGTGFYHGGASAVPRELISYDGPYGANTIVINTDERRLYYVYAKGKAIKYGIGVGREGFQWSGTDTISNKAEWPGWTPPPEMIVREKAKGRILPNYMAGGLDNPLGARALYIGGRIYRIHGSNEPWTIGHAVSSGCIRLTNDDVVDLYDRVPVGTRVVVLLSTQPQTEEAVATAGSEDKPMPPNAVLKTRLPVKAPAPPVLAVKASAKAIDASKPADKPVLIAKVPPKPAAEIKAPVIEAKAMVEPAPEPKAVEPVIAVKASGSAAISVSPPATAAARAMIELKRPIVVPETVSRKDEPVDTTPVATVPLKPPPGEDVSGEGRS